jgi:hypothetical protein
VEDESSSGGPWATGSVQPPRRGMGLARQLSVRQCGHVARAAWQLGLRHGALPAAMATGPIAGLTVKDWSRPRQEVGWLWDSRKEGEGEKLLGQLRFWTRSIVKLS